MQRRHKVLLAAGVIGAVDLFIAVTTGSVPQALAPVAILSPFVALIALFRSPWSELKTLAVWSVILLFGGGAVKMLIQPKAAPGLTVDQFGVSHPVGIAITAITVVALVLLIEAVLVLGCRKAIAWRTGGSGGIPDKTPEERVLSEEEFDNFDPLDTLPRLVRSSI